jgi:hypothetical protein
MLILRTHLAARNPVVLIGAVFKLINCEETAAAGHLSSYINAEICTNILVYVSLPNMYCEFLNITWQNYNLGLYSVALFTYFRDEMLIITWIKVLCLLFFSLYTGHLSASIRGHLLDAKGRQIYFEMSVERSIRSRFMRISQHGVF